MAAFDKSALTQVDADGEPRPAPLDLTMLLFGPVTLFRKPSVLADSVSWLVSHGYTVVQVDCESCRSEQDLLWAIGDAVGFEHWPHPGLDGFYDDCYHLEVSEDGGFAVVLHRFDAVAVAFPQFARRVLDILSWTSRENLIFGRRFLCLVRSEDPWIQFGPVGGHEPHWNDREWFNSDRA